VLQRRAKITAGMVDSWRVQFPPNNREILPLNGRTLLANEVDLNGEFIWKDRDAYDG